MKQKNVASFLNVKNFNKKFDKYQIWDLKFTERSSECFQVKK